MIVVFDKKRRFKVEVLREGSLYEVYSTENCFCPEEAVQERLEKWGWDYGTKFPEEGDELTFIVTDLDMDSTSKPKHNGMMRYQVAIQATYGWSCKQVCMPKELK